MFVVFFLNVLFIATQTTNTTHDPDLHDKDTTRTTQAHDHGHDEDGADDYNVVDDTLLILSQQIKS